MKISKPLAALDEKEFTGLVIGTSVNPGVARMFGYRCYHVLRSKGSAPGFPDWTCVGDRVVFLELKTEKGPVSAAQASWMETFAKAAVEAYIVRPRHFDAITCVLRARGPIAGWNLEARQARGELLVELDRHIERRAA